MLCFLIIYILFKLLEFFLQFPLLLHEGAVYRGVPHTWSQGHSYWGSGPRANPFVFLDPSHPNPATQATRGELSLLEIEWTKERNVPWEVSTARKEVS